MTPADYDSIFVCSGDPLSPSPAMTPADDPILICSLPQPEPDLGLGLGSTTEPPPSNEIKQSIHPVPKRLAASKRKSRGVHLGSSDSDEDKQQSEPLLGNRILPPTIRYPINKENQKDPIKKVGSCNVNPPPLKDSSEKSEKIGSCNVNPSGKIGSCNVNPSVKIGSCSANPPVISNLLDVYGNFSQEHIKMIGEMDILEIAAMKGIRIDPPRWHRSGGYDAKPKDSK